MLTTGNLIVAPVRTVVRPRVESMQVCRVGARYKISPVSGEPFVDRFAPAVDRHGQLWVEYTDAHGTCRQLCREEEVRRVNS